MVIQKPPNRRLLDWQALTAYQACLFRRSFYPAECCEAQVFVQHFNLPETHFG